MYSRYQLRLFCEIGLVKNLHDMVHNYHKNSKFGGFLTNLEKTCLKIQKKHLPPPTQNDYNEAGVYLERFGDKMKWTDRQLSPNYMFCFCLRLLGETKTLKSKKLLDIMTKLVSYQEDCGKIDDEHYADGDFAYTCWLSCWNETDVDEHDKEVSQKVLQKTTADVIRENEFEHYKQCLYGGCNARSKTESI